MLNSESRINVVCPNCGKKFKERVGRLHDVAAFRHACGAWVECDLNELDKFVRKQANDALAQFRLRLGDPKRYG
jgi:hypothetical protein